jgi:hypothetical protein
VLAISWLWQNAWHKELKRRKDLFWFTVSEGSSPHDREGIVEQSSSHHGKVEVEIKNTCNSGISLFSPFFLPGPTTFRMGLATLVNSLWKCPQIILRGMFYQSPRCFSIQLSWKSRLTIMYPIFTLLQLTPHCHRHICGSVLFSTWLWWMVSNGAYCKGG